MLIPVHLERKIKEMEIYKNMHRRTNVTGKIKRVLAASIAVVMISTMANCDSMLTANAMEETSEGATSSTTKETDIQKTVKGFDALSSDVIEQNIPVGGKESDIDLPDTLKADVSLCAEKTDAEKVIQRHQAR